jgi:hypothetical protein
LKLAIFLSGDAESKEILMNGLVSLLNDLPDAAPGL